MSFRVMQCSVYVDNLLHLLFRADDIEEEEEEEDKTKVESIKTSLSIHLNLTSLRVFSH